MAFNDFVYAPPTAIYINQVNLFLLSFFKRNIINPIFKSMYPGRGFKINNNSGILKLNVEIFTRLKGGSCSLYIGLPAKSGAVYFVHWFAGQKWGRVLCTLIHQTKSGGVYFVHSFPVKKWGRVLCTSVSESGGKAWLSKTCHKTCRWI